MQGDYANQPRLWQGAEYFIVRLICKYYPLRRLRQEIIIIIIIITHAKLLELLSSLILPTAFTKHVPPRNVIFFFLMKNQSETQKHVKNEIHLSG